MIIRGVYDTVQPPPSPRGVEPSPLTPSDIKQMPAVAAEAGRTDLEPQRSTIRRRAGRTDAETGGGGGGVGWEEAHVGPLCPQLSEPANDSSQGGCCKGSREIETDAPAPGPLHVWLRAAIQRARSLSLPHQRRFSTYQHRGTMNESEDWRAEMTRSRERSAASRSALLCVRVCV